MPIFDQGYQHWQGTLSGHGWRWLTITRQGLRAQMKSIWPRLVVLSAWIPALVLATALVFWGLLEKKSLPSWLSWFQDMVAELGGTDPKAFRITVWTYAYSLFFKWQTFFSMILVMMIGPALISQDLRFNAIPLYFSRPLRRIDYFLGKLGVIAAVLAAVAIVPAVLAYGLGVAFSLDLSVGPDTFRIVLASIAGGLILVLSAGTLMLAISSLSRNSLTIGAIWFGFWLLSFWGAFALNKTARADWCNLFSYTDNVIRIEEALLDTETAYQPYYRFRDEQRKKAQQAAERYEAMERARLARNRQGPAHGSGMVVEQHEPMPAEAPPARGRDSTYPWYWSAGVLAGLFGISVWILSLRVKSLDRLR